LAFSRQHPTITDTPSPPLHPFKVSRLYPNVELYLIAAVVIVSNIGVGCRRMRRLLARVRRQASQPEVVRLWTLLHGRPDGAPAYGPGRCPHGQTEGSVWTRWSSARRHPWVHTSR